MSLGDALVAVGVDLLRIPMRGYEGLGVDPGGAVVAVTNPHEGL